MLGGGGGRGEGGGGGGEGGGGRGEGASEENSSRLAETRIHTGQHARTDKRRD